MKSALKDEPTVVLDACALIAFFNDEPGADVVAEALRVVPVVEMAAINLLEIAYDAVRRSGQPHSARDVLKPSANFPFRFAATSTMIFSRWRLVSKPASAFPSPTLSR